MKITILVEGRTETAFKSVLLAFLKRHIPHGKMPKLDFFPYDGRIPKGEELRKKVDTVLQGASASDHVIALTDVYTGTHDFVDGDDAKKKMRDWVGNNPRFSPHVAQYDFEAWLLPYWSEIQRLAGHKKSAPGANPEEVNHTKPPSYHIKEIFEIGTAKRSYTKSRDALRILNGQDLGVAVVQCNELKAFVNTIIQLSGGNVIS